MKIFTNILTLLSIYALSKFLLTTANQIVIEAFTLLGMMAMIGYILGILVIKLER